MKITVRKIPFISIQVLHCNKNLFQIIDAINTGVYSLRDFSENKHF